MVFRACLILSFILLSACIDLEDDAPGDTPVSTTPDNDNTPATSSVSALNGIYTADITETQDAGTSSTTTTARVLIYEGAVFGLREDKAFYGVVTAGSLTPWLLTLEFYDFALASADDKEYAASDNNDNFTVNALINATGIQGTYESTNTITGRISLVNRNDYDDGSAIADLAGSWNTSATLANTLDVSSDGMHFTATEVITSQDNCSFYGEFQLINSQFNLFAVKLTRPNDCSQFSFLDNSGVIVDVSGFAVINPDGELEMYFWHNNELLFLTYTKVASAGATTPETPTEPEVPVAE